MLLASQPNAPVARMIINDVGPFVPKAGLDYIASYVGRDPRFADVAEAEAIFRKVAVAFGSLRDEHWRHLAEISTRPDGNGKLRLHYDMGLALPYKSPQTDMSFWPVWDAITCPVLLLRGTESNLLLAETAREMTMRGPKTTLVEIAGCGHAPPLMQADQIAIVRGWLAGRA